MKKNIILATNSEGKVAEFKRIMGEEYDIISLKEANIDIEVEETCRTFYGNAFKKAKEIAQAIEENYPEFKNFAVLADDSGLMVEALDNKPGVLSARYAADHDQLANNKKVIENMKGKTNRNAFFACTLVLIDMSNELVLDSVGCCHGKIAEDIIDGQYGFGYDAIFIPEENNPEEKTFSQLETCKDEIGHRARAIRCLKGKLDNEI